MTFLAPITGLIAAGIAAPILLLFYLLKLRRRPVRVSTVLFWAQATKDLQANTPFRWLRPSLLLLLHLLLLACLCLAIARPLLDLPGEASGRIVLLMDRSASMSSTDIPADALSGSKGGASVPPVSRLDLAKARATELIDRLGSSDAQVMLVSFASRAQTLVNFTRDRSQVRAAIQAITPTDEPARFGQALKVVAAFARLGDTATDSPSSLPRVILVSDGGIRPDADDPPPGLGEISFELIRAGPPVPPGDARPVSADNVGIVALSAKREFEDPTNARIFVRLQSASTKPLSVPLTCEIGPTRVASLVLEVPALSGPPDAALPGEASHIFEVPSAEGGIVTVSIGRADALASDNTSRLVLAPLRTAKIVVVTGAAAQADASRAALTDAITTLERCESRIIAPDAFNQAVSTNRLGPCDLVVFSGAAPAALPPGVATLSFGTAIPIPGIRLTAPGSTGDSAGSGFSQWSRSHPVMRYVSLADVWLDRPYTIVWPERDQSLRATPLGWGADGPVIVLFELGRTRHLMIGAELSQTNWIKDASFPIFIANAVDLLTGRAEQSAGQSWLTGEAVDVPMPGPATASPSATTSHDARLTAPDGSERAVPVNADALAAVGVVERSGLYTLRDGQASLPIAVNLLDPWESRIATSANLQIGGKPVGVSSPGAIAPREVWSWFVLAALAIMTIEWFLFAWKSRV